MITVVLVRHADIDLPPSSTNPSLNSAGLERTEILAHLAGATGVTTALHSPFTRTKQTVAPLAAQLGLPIREAPRPSTLVEQVLPGDLGETILIAGHSNTVPQMIGALGAASPPPSIGERDFGNLFAVSIPEFGKAGIAHLKYGKRSS